MQEDSEEIVTFNMGLWASSLLTLTGCMLIACYKMASRSSYQSTLRCLCKSRSALVNSDISAASQKDTTKVKKECCDQFFGQFLDIELGEDLAPAQKYYLSESPIAPANTRS